MLDPNITACRDKRDLMAQYRETGAVIDFTQGLDIRLLNDADIEDLNAMRIKNVHFAWDNPAEDLKECFRRYAETARHKPHGDWGTVYILTGYENCSVKEHIERAEYRIMTVAEMGYFPYLMVYDRPHAPKELLRMQRWCNNKIIFKSCKKFEEYRP